MMRRTFLLASGAALLGARAALAQQKVWRVALVAPVLPVTELTESGPLASWGALFTELRARLVVEGQNVTFERYSGQGQNDKYEALGRMVATTKPDLIFVGGDTVIARAAAEAAPDVPVVFQVGDALATGLVSNLAHPGGNLTGTQSTSGYEIEGKRMELLREGVPRGTRIGYMGGAGATAASIALRTAAQEAASRLGLTYVNAAAEPPYDEGAYRRAFAAAAEANTDMLLVAQSTQNNSAVPWIAAFAKAARLPTLAPYATFAMAGGLMSYAGTAGESYRGCGEYIARILYGEKAADLPVRQPQKYDLIVNTMAAKELGLTVPPSLLLLADQVIE